MTRTIEAYRMQDRFGIAIRLGERDDHGHICAVANPVTMRNFVEDGTRLEPMVYLDAREAQALFDSMWSNGFIPTHDTMIEKVKDYVDDKLAALSFKACVNE